MAAVFWLQLADKPGLPARHKAVIRLQCADTGKTGIDSPQALIPPSNIVNIDHASVMRAAANKTGIGFGIDRGI